MSLIASIKNFLSKKTATIEAPADFCPNCWGRQEYGGKILEAIRHENIDLNNLDSKTGWVQAYAVRNFEGIKLHKKGEVLECQACSLTYE